MGGVSPIGLVQKNSVPLKSPLPEELIESQAWIFNRPVALLSGGNQMFDKAVDVRVPGEEVPVEPADLIVLAIRVIIAILGPSHLITHQEHGCAERKQRDREKVLYLSIAEFFDIRIVGGPFDAAVPAQVVVSPIPVGLAVLLVVLEVVRDKIIESKPVVAGDKINALLRLAFFVAIDVGAGK